MQGGKGQGEVGSFSKNPTRYQYVIRIPLRLIRRSSSHLRALVIVQYGVNVPSVAHTAHIADSCASSAAARVGCHSRGSSLTTPIRR